MGKRDGHIYVLKAVLNICRQLDGRVVFPTVDMSDREHNSTREAIISVDCGSMAIWIGCGSGDARGCAIGFGGSGRGYGFGIVWYSACFAGHHGLGSHREFFHELA